MHNRLLHRCLAVLAVSCVTCTAGAETPAEEVDGIFAHAELTFAAGEGDRGEALYRIAMSTPLQHTVAYGRLVQIALGKQDAAALKQLFSAQRAFAFEAPQEFRSRIQVYEMLRLRRTYNEAVQAAARHQGAEAERSFAQLLGDEPYHRQAVGWLFRLAMQQKDFARARFIADLARSYTDDPAATPELLAACALQRIDQRESALAQIKQDLTRRGAYRGDKDARVDAQRAVYVAMIRLHEENDQCYLHAWKTPAEANSYFPALPDAVLSYIAR